MPSTDVYLRTIAAPVRNAPTSRAPRALRSVPAIHATSPQSVSARLGTSAISVDAETRNAGDATHAAVVQPGVIVKRWASRTPAITAAIANGSSERCQRISLGPPSRLTAASQYEIQGGFLK